MHVVFVHAVRRIIFTNFIVEDAELPHILYYTIFYLCILYIYIYHLHYLSKFIQLPLCYLHIISELYFTSIRFGLSVIDEEGAGEAVELGEGEGHE